MKVFLSHAQKDYKLARKLGKRLATAGFAVWIAEDQIVPGDNWAKKLGKALDDSELMVTLLTPGAMASDAVRQNIEYAIGAKRFAYRLFTVFVGPKDEVPKDIPWILWRLAHRQVRSAKDFGTVAEAIRQYAESNLSGTHA